MEIGWGGDTWDSRINLKYSQNLPILRADSMGGSPQARHEDRRRWIKDTFVAAIVAPFHARGKFHSCAKKQHRTQSNLTVHLDLWARCSWSFSRSSSTKGWHTAHIYFMKPRLISPPPSLLQIRLQFFFFLGNYRITKQYRQNYTSQSLQLESGAMSLYSGAHKGPHTLYGTEKPEMWNHQQITNSLKIICQYF